MQQNLGPWGSEMDAAWLAFRADLVGRLGALRPTEVLALGNGQADALPCVRFGLLEDDNVVGEVLGNDGEACRRLNSCEIALLSSIGWNRIPDESEPAVTHWSLAEPAAYDALVLMAERTLREAFGVVHPAFLEAGSTLGVEVGDAPEEPVAFPASGDELDRLVESTLRPVLGERWERGEGGDLVATTGETEVHVGVAAGAQAVDVCAVLVKDVVDPARALAEVNILNRDPDGATYTFRNDRILARRRISARPFVPQQLREAVATAIETYDELAGDLVGRVGGRRCLAEPEEAHDPAEVVPVQGPVHGSTQGSSRGSDQSEGSAGDGPARVYLRTLMHLEVDQPGSVDARLAAHIFHHDSTAIVGQITWLRRDGRVALVPLLRQALRLVVESEARQSSSG